MSPSTDPGAMDRTMPCKVSNYSESSIFRDIGALATGISALELDVWITSTETSRRYPARVLIDSGASGNFVNKQYAEDKFVPYQLEDPIPVRNADGSENRGGPISEDIDVWIDATDASHGEMRQRLRLEIVDLGKTYDVILGFPWLQQWNPMIDWKAGTIQFFNLDLPSSGVAGTLASRTSVTSNVDQEDDEDPEESLESYIRTVLKEMDHGRNTSVIDDMKKFVPSKYWEKYEKVFTKDTFNTLPPHSEFDHTIELEESFVPQRGKIYRLSPREQDELRKFIQENLDSGRIRVSNSPQATPFFFTTKAEEVNAQGQDPGLRPLQDYRYLNSHTIRD